MAHCPHERTGGNLAVRPQLSIPLLSLLSPCSNFYKYYFIQIFRKYDTNICDNQKSRDPLPVGGRGVRAKRKRCGCALTCVVFALVSLSGIASISINLRQSASIKVNQHQSTSISIKQYQSASININQYQTTSISFNQLQSTSISINQ